MPGETGLLLPPSYDELFANPETGERAECAAQTLETSSSAIDVCDEPLPSYEQVVKQNQPPPAPPCKVIQIETAETDDEKPTSSDSDDNPTPTASSDESEKSE